MQSCSQESENDIKRTLEIEYGEIENRAGTLDPLMERVADGISGSGSPHEADVESAIEDAKAAYASAMDSLRQAHVVSTLALLSHLVSRY